MRQARTEPGPPPGPGIFLPDGVTIESLPVGGLAVEEAREVVESMFNQEDPELAPTDYFVPRDKRSGTL